MKRDIIPSQFRWKVIYSHFEYKPHDLYVMEALSFQWDYKECPSHKGPSHYITGSLAEIKDRVAQAAEGALYRNSEGLFIFSNKMEVYEDQEVYSIDVFSRRNGSLYTLASVHITPY
jgi:hypothetical protein